MVKAQYIILFTLSGLVVITVVAILAASLGYPPGAQESTLAKWGPVGILAEIIALFWFVAKVVFAERVPTLIVGSVKKPPEMRDFDITQIDWKKEECFVLYRDGGREKIADLVPFREGVGFRVSLPDGLLEKIQRGDSLELELRDKKGNTWRVESFLPYENLLHLSISEPPEKISKDYGEDEQ